MRKLIAVAVLAMTASALAGITGFQANMSQLGSFGTGGAFAVSLRDHQPGNIVAGGNPTAFFGTVPAGLRFGDIGGAKTTFCIENVTFSLGTWYAASVDSTILNGGGSNPDTLTQVTKNLFAEYVYGVTSVSAETLAQYVGIDAVRNKALQNIFWAQQGTGLSNGTGGGIAAAMAYITTNWANAAGSTAGSASVRVLNLWQGPNPYQGDKQSHLVAIPLPAAAFLGLIGLGGAAWLKRRT